MNNFLLTLELSENGPIWGRTLVEDNLIADAADTQPKLEANLKQLIRQFHGIDPATITFIIEYDTHA
ncbi:hypothetical protein [Runella zeae]|uniref:hypothetical protein n=1 Tax=Runella zeae TaxID=94255 RepID=UPI002357DFB5|nr:hypothetical protein [Runella zeae]